MRLKRYLPLDKPKEDTVLNRFRIGYTKITHGYLISYNVDTTLGSNHEKHLDIINFTKQRKLFSLI